SNKSTRSDPNMNPNLVVFINHGSGSNLNTRFRSDPAPQIRSTEH
ncbi:7524_t:CDS:1, partial [Dentiscutata erythropus]